MLMPNRWRGEPASFSALLRRLSRRERAVRVRALSTAVAAIVIGTWVSACGSPATANPTTPPGVETPFVSNARAWHKVPIPPDAEALSVVACLSDSTCVAAGSTNKPRALIIVSSDRGQTWREPTLPDGLQGVTNLVCPTSADCYAVTRALAGSPKDPYVLLSSRDAGVTWQASNLPTAVAGITCWNATSCLIVGGWEGEGVAAFKTTDGGLHWTAFDLSRTSAQSLDAVTCADEQHCWVTVNRFKGAYVLATNDGGHTWAEQLRNLGGYDDLSDLYCQTIARCWSIPTASNSIFFTDNGGETWSRQPIPDRVFSISSLACSSEVVCVVVGFHDILSTRDGGAHWGLETWPGGVSLHAVACHALCVAVGETGVVVSNR